MPDLSYSYTLANATTTDADKVMANFNNVKSLLNTTGLDADNIAADSITNALISSSAAIDFSKLATLTDGNILVGNSSNVAASVNPSGDVDVSNAGVFSIASGAIVNADVNASAAIAYSKLALTGAILNADVSASAAVAYSKLATLNTNQILAGNAGTPTATTLSGDATIGATGVVTVANAAKMTTTARARVYRSTSQTYTANTNNKVAFNAESFDTGSNFDSATNNRFTCPVTGTYLVCTRLTLNAYSGRYIVLLYKNGSVYARGEDNTQGGLATGTGTSTWAVPCTATDYLEIFFNPVAGGVTNQGGSNYEQENYATFDFLGA